MNLAELLTIPASMYPDLEIVRFERQGWTYAAFLHTAKALTRNGKYGFGAWPYPDSWLPFALSDGARYLTATRARIGR